MNNGASKYYEFANQYNKGKIDNINNANAYINLENKQKIVHNNI